MINRRKIKNAHKLLNQQLKDLKKALVFSSHPFKLYEIKIQTPLMFCVFNFKYNQFLVDDILNIFTDYLNNIELYDFELMINFTNNIDEAKNFYNNIHDKNFIHTFEPIKNLFRRYTLTEEQYRNLSMSDHNMYLCQKRFFFDSPQINCRTGQTDLLHYFNISYEFICKKNPEKRKAFFKKLYAGFLYKCEKLKPKEIKSALQMSDNEFKNVQSNIKKGFYS